MVKDFESIGISAIAVHGRYKHQNSNEPLNKGTLPLLQSKRKNLGADNSFDNWKFSKLLDAIRRIVESVRIPVIGNGVSNEIESFEDIQKFRDECGVTSVMIARAAQKNVSIFRKEGEATKAPFYGNAENYIFSLFSAQAYWIPA